MSDKIKVGKVIRHLNAVAHELIKQRAPSLTHGPGQEFSDFDLWEYRDILPGHPWSDVSRVTDPKIGRSVIRCQLQRYGLGGFKDFQGIALFRGNLGRNAWAPFPFILKVNPIPDDPDGCPSDSERYDLETGRPEIGVAA